MHNESAYSAYNIHLNLRRTPAEQVGTQLQKSQMMSWNYRVIQGNPVIFAARKTNWAVHDWWLLVTYSSVVYYCIYKVYTKYYNTQTATLVFLHLRKISSTTTPKSNYFLTYKDKFSASFSTLWYVILARVDWGSPTTS